MTSTESSNDLLTRFATQVKAVDGRFASITNLSEAQEYMLKLIKSKNVKRIVSVSKELSSKLFPPNSPLGNLEITSKESLPREEFFKAVEAADVGISPVDAAVAETGTLVILTSDESDRLVTALPEIHVAIVPRSKIVSSLREVEPLITEMLTHTKSGATVSLISASSRTADIGDKTILGMHGPKELHVLVLDEELL